MSLVIGDGITSRLETPRDYVNISARHADPLNLQKQEPQALSDNISSNILSLANQFTTQDHPSQSELGLKDPGNETPLQGVSTAQDGKNFIKVPHRKKGRAATLKSKERYYQVEKVYNVSLAKKEPIFEVNENNSTKIKEDKLPKVQIPASSSPTKMVTNHRSRFTLFSPYTKIKDGDEKDAKVISTKARAASQPLVSIAGESPEKKSQKKTLPNLLEKLPQIFLYSEKEEEANSFIYPKKPVENSEAFVSAKKIPPTRKKAKSKELPPIYSKQKLNDIQKQYSRSQNQSDGLESKNRRKSLPKRSSQLKFSLIESNTENRANTFETSMNNSFIHHSPVKKDFKRQRSSTGQSDRVSTQPSNKLQSDSFNDNNQETQPFLEVPEKNFRNKFPPSNKKSEEKIIKQPSELFPATNNNIVGRHRSKSSSRYDGEQTDILIKPNDSTVHIPPKQEPSSPERPKIIKSESLPQNQHQHQHQQAKFLPQLDSSPKKHAPATLIQERYAEIMRAKKDERKLTDDQRYQQLIKNKIEDQFTELFKHFRNKKTKSNHKRVQFITET